MATEGTAMYTSSLLAPTTAATATVNETPVSNPQMGVDPSVAAVAVAASVPSASIDNKPMVPVSVSTATGHPAITPGTVAASAAAAAAAAAAVHPPPPQHPPQMPMAAAAFGQYPPGVMFAPPDPSVIDDQPTYVNPKQYARILKRRESRKKQTGTDVTSYTPRKRSYMHESRHKHAMQRRRGPGGRFLSKEEREQVKESQAAAQ